MEMKTCSHEKKRCEKHDAYYCPTCDIWTEKGCEQPDCEFCKDRPEKPSQVSKEEK